MNDSLKHNSLFLSLWLVTVLALTIAVCAVDKASLHLALCDHHSAWADRLMPVLSDFANWLPYVIAAGLLIGRWRTGLFVTIALLLSTGMTQLVKHLVKAPRPLSWFAEHYPDVTLPLTDGVTMNYWLSFPSGHTTTFFCLFFALSVVATAYIAKARNAHAGQPTVSDYKKYIILSVLVQLVCFILAAVCSYSRIYLSQHFALDVLAGMIIGVLAVWIVLAVYSLKDFSYIH